MEKVCVKCDCSKDITEFHANNKTGWSKYCKDCRRKRQQKVNKQRLRKFHKMKEKAEIEIEQLKQKQLERAIKQLQTEYKRFTLLNRNRLQVMLRRCEGRKELSERTRQAIENRRLNQERAEQILNYQIQVVSAGLKTHHISKLWRSRYGNDTGGQSQSPD